MSACTCSTVTPGFMRPMAPSQCVPRTSWPCGVSMRLTAASGPANDIGAHRSMVVDRVNPDGPSIDPYGKVKSAGITPTIVADTFAICNRSPDDVRVAAEAALPEGMADENLRTSFVVPKRTSEDRRPAKQVEQSRRDGDADDDFGRAVGSPARTASRTRSSPRAPRGSGSSPGSP